VHTSGQLDYMCRACPGCGGICEIISSPTEDVAPGTPICLEQRCTGACPDGPNHQCVEPGVCVCTAKNCGQLGKECGTWDNGCGTTINCGGHGTCQQSGQKPNAFCAPDGKCACPKNTCHALGKTCGSWDDGCGGIVNCGDCRHLGANGECAAGICTCRPRTYCGSNECGVRPDGCGGTIDCQRECASQTRPNGFCNENGQCDCRPDTCASLGRTCGGWPDGCGNYLNCGPQALLCGDRDDPTCCGAGQTCCPHGPDYWGLPSECCDWSVCHRYPGGAFKGCCPADNQCVQQDGNKICCPENWMCGGNSPHGEKCCVRSGHGDAVLNIEPRYCCSGSVHGTEHGWICD
jgi:hypothetical protein